MNDSIEDIILNALMHDETYCRKALPHLKPVYFDGPYRDAFELIVDFITDYNKLPSAKVLAIELGNSKLAAKQNVNDIFQLINEQTTKVEYEADWILENTEKWCKDRAVHLAVMESITIIDGSNTEKAPGAIPELLSNALSITFDTNVGHDYIENAAERYDYYHQDEERMAFDLEMLNKITGGGIPRKTLNCIMAGTGAGKSLAMCHLAAAALADQRNILYITMEMSEEKIAERIDANLLNTHIASLKDLSESEFHSRVNNVKAKSQGKLIIKEYPTASAHSGHFRALLTELKMKKDFVPDLIFIDYLNICTSSRMKGIGGSVNSYTLIKSIAEEIRGLAVEFNVPIWTATQTNRDGLGASDVDLTNTSECIAVSEKVTSRTGQVMTMDEVSVGDQILSNDEYKTVMFKHHNKMKDCVKIRTKSGKTIVVSKDHVFPSKSSDSLVARLSVNEGLKVGDLLHTTTHEG